MTLGHQHHIIGISTSLELEVWGNSGRDEDLNVSLPGLPISYILAMTRMTMRRMTFGYVPDFRGRRPFVDLALHLVGYPYAPRRNEARKVLELLNPHPGERILDLGCGDGVWFLELVRRDIEVIGLDISSRDVRKASTRLCLSGLRASLVTASATEIPFMDSSFEKVFSLNTIEHIREDRQVIREAFRVLRPGGCCVVSVPSGHLPGLLRRILYLPAGFKAAFGSDLVVSSENEHDFLEAWNSRFHQFRVYDGERLIGLFEEAGFQDMEIFGNGGPLAGSAWSLLRGLRLFEWNKGPDRGYELRHRALFLASFPLFYMAYRMDDLLQARHPLGWIIRARK